MKLISIKPELVEKFSKLDSEVLIKEKRPTVLDAYIGIGEGDIVPRWH